MRIGNADTLNLDSRNPNSIFPIPEGVPTAGNCPQEKAKRYSPTVKIHYVYRVSALYIYLYIFIYVYVYVWNCKRARGGQCQPRKPPFINTKVCSVAHEVTQLRYRQLFKVCPTVKVDFIKKLIAKKGEVNSPFLSTLFIRAYVLVLIHINAL